MIETLAVIEEIVTILSGIVTMIGGIFASVVIIRKLDKTHGLVNSNTKELIRLSNMNARAEGVASEKRKARAKKRPPANRIV